MMRVSDIEAYTRLVLLGHEHVVIGPSWGVAGLRSPFWRLYVHERDGAEAQVGQRVFLLGPGRVHLIPAWLTFSHRTRRPVDQFYVHFEMVRWTALTTQRLAPRPVSLAMDPALRATWEAVIARRGAEPRPTAAGSMRVTALVQSALARWMEGLDPGEIGRALGAGGGRKEVEPALVYIERHLGEPVLNEALAACCHYSVDHFGRVFRQVVGQTPARYVRERRITAAAQALALTQRSIEDIAASTGFANRFHFSRAFKRHIGTPPAAYRARNRPDRRGDARVPGG